MCCFECASQSPSQLRWAQTNVRWLPTPSYRCTSANCSPPPDFKFLCGIGSSWLPKDCEQTFWGTSHNVAFPLRLAKEAPWTGIDVVAIARCCKWIRTKMKHMMDNTKSQEDPHSLTLQEAAEVTMCSHRYELARDPRLLTLSQSPTWVIHIWDQLWRWRTPRGWKWWEGELNVCKYILVFLIVYVQSLLVTWGVGCCFKSCIWPIQMKPDASTLLG